MSRKVTGTGGVRLRKAASEKYERECMTCTDEGVEVNHAGIIYLWCKGFVMEPWTLHPGSEPVCLKANAVSMKWATKLRDSMREASGRDIRMFFSKNHNWDQYLLNQEYEGQVKSAAEWNRIFKEKKDYRWKHQMPGDVTHVDFKAEQEGGE